MDGVCDRTDLDGFPDEYSRRVAELRSGWLGILRVLGIFTAIAGVSAWIGVMANGEVAWLGLAAVCGAVALYLTVVQIGALCDLSSTRRQARIVPYFEADVPGEDTFFDSGHALARNCAYLDRIAVEAGLTPVSAFGFGDALRDEPFDWRDPQEGARTFTGVLERLRAQPDAVPEAEAVIADLERIESRLQEAVRLKVRFCLHFRMDWAYSLQEFEIRPGKY